MTATSDIEKDWAGRVGYVFGLTSSDPAERAIALTHLSEARGRVNETLERFNEAWFSARHLGADQWNDLELRRRHVEYAEAQWYAFPDALWNRPNSGLADWPGLPYALQYLEWEARYPDDWTLHAKKWGTKESLIRDLAIGDHREPVRAALIQLVIAAVSRAYRCKDREYVRIARAVDGDDLRAGLTDAANSSSPWARLNAGYVLRLLDDLALPNSRHTWRTWCAADV